MLLNRQVWVAVRACEVDFSIEATEWVWLHSCGGIMAHTTPLELPVYSSSAASAIIDSRK